MEGRAFMRAKVLFVLNESSILQGFQRMSGRLCSFIVVALNALSFHDGIGGEEM